MATIQNRGIYQWRAQIRRKGFPPQSETFETKEAAQKWARKIEREMDTGRWSDTSKADETLLADALDRYLETVSSKKKGSSSKYEASRIRTIKKHPIAKTALSKIRSANIAEYRDYRSNEVSPNSVRLELALISHLFTIASQEWGMENLENPVKKTKKPNIAGTNRDRRVSYEELQNLEKACEQAPRWLHPTIHLAIETGMRRGELASLTWIHVDFDKRVIHLPDTKLNSSRNVPLSSKAITILLKLKEQELDDLVIGVHPERISKVFQKYCQIANIKDFRFHDLRHEATSRFFELGLNPMQVAAITGHKTLQMLKRYTHLKAEDLAKLLG